MTRKMEMMMKRYEKRERKKRMKKVAILIF